MSRRDTRHRRTKTFRVIRQETYYVSFTVEATSQLKARQTPTPADANRTLAGSTGGHVETIDDVGRFVLRQSESSSE